MNQKQNLIDFLTSRIKARAKGAAVAFELKDLNEQVVTFEVTDESEIAEGTKASPDGTFTFVNGKTITVEGGVVTKIEVVEEEKKEETETTEEEVKADETEEIDKDAKIAELETENEQLKQEIETLKSKLQEVQGEIDEKEKELEEEKKEVARINNFAKTLGYDEHKEYRAEDRAIADATGRPMFRYNKN